MDGFYSIWSKPYLKNKKTTEYFMQDFEVLTLLLSVLKWQEKNGKAKMIADDAALKFLQKKNLLDFFEDGVSALEVDESISTEVFWAAGKLYALKKQNKPSVMIDLDLIIWQDMKNWFEESELLVIHREEIAEHVYPDKSFFRMEPGFAFPGRYDWSVRPCNTAMLYYKDVDFKNYYAETSIDFMKRCTEKSENLKHMVFAEQRLLSILAKEKQIEIKAIFELASDIGMQDLFTHVWGHKNILRFNYEERTRYCQRVIGRIKNDFPEAFEKIADCKDFKEYISQ